MGLSAVALFASTNGRNSADAPPTPNPALAARGAVIYAGECAACHGANLEGAPNWKLRSADGAFPPPPHDDTGHTWHHADELLLDIILNGGDPAFDSKMPAFKEKLNREEAQAVLEFIKSKWGSEQRAYQWQITTAGR